MLGRLFLVLVMLHVSNPVEPYSNASGWKQGFNNTYFCPIMCSANVPVLVHLCMTCTVQSNLVYLCNLSLFSCSCVLWPFLTAENALWQWLRTKRKHHVCLSLVTDHWSGNACVNENAKAVQNCHVRDSTIWLSMKYSSLLPLKVQDGTYQRSSGTYTYVCVVRGRHCS